MLLAEKFGMEYVDADGQKKTPYIIHRTSLGCYERTLAYLIERFAGAFPLWLSPEQVRVLTITARADEAALKVQKELQQQGMRVEVALRNEKIGFKVREAVTQKGPYMLVLGDKEVEDGTVAVRTRKGENLGVMKLDEVIAMFNKEIESKEI